MAPPDRTTRDLTGGAAAVSARRATLAYSQDLVRGARGWTPTPLPATAARPDVYDGDYAGEESLIASYGSCEAGAKAVLSVRAGKMHYHDAVNGSLDGPLQFEDGGIIRIRNGIRQLTGRIVDDGFAGSISGGICDYAYRFRRVAATVAARETSPESGRTEAMALDQAEALAPASRHDRMAPMPRPASGATASVLVRLRRSLAQDASTATAPSPLPASPLAATSAQAAPAASASAVPPPPAAMPGVASDAVLPPPPKPAAGDAEIAAADPAATASSSPVASSPAPAPLSAPGFADAQALALDRNAAARDGTAAAVLAAAVPALQELANQPDAKVQAVAQYDLGYCYENGVGVAADKLRAYVYYIRASVAPGATAGDALPGNADVTKAALKAALDLQAGLTPSDYSAAVAMLEQGAP